MVRYLQIAIVALCAAVASCSEVKDDVSGQEEAPLSRPETPQEAAYTEPQADGSILRWNYQNTLLYFSKGNLEASVVDNPRKLGANKTRRCLMLALAALRLM